MNEAAVAASLTGFAATLALDVQTPTPVEDLVLLSDESAFASVRPRTSARLAEEATVQATLFPKRVENQPEKPDAKPVEQSRLHANGRLRDQVGLDVAGRPDGPYVSYYETGAVWETGQFANGAKTGVWRVQHENGLLREESTFAAGRAEGLARAWNVDGQLLRETTMHGLPEGPATTWHANGQMESQGSYRQGRRAGAWRFWNPDGSEDTRRSGDYESDRRLDG